jgi:hypothetical protein
MYRKRTNKVGRKKQARTKEEPAAATTDVATKKLVKKKKIAEEQPVEGAALMEATTPRTPRPRAVAPMEATTPRTLRTRSAVRKEATALQAQEAEAGAPSSKRFVGHFYLNPFATIESNTMHLYLL